MVFLEEAGQSTFFFGEVPLTPLPFGLRWVASLLGAEDGLRDRRAPCGRSPRTGAACASRAPQGATSSPSDRLTVWARQKRTRTEHARWSFWKKNKSLRYCYLTITLRPSSKGQLHLNTNRKTAQANQTSGQTTHSVFLQERRLYGSNRFKGEGQLIRMSDLPFPADRSRARFARIQSRQGAERKDSRCGWRRSIY